MGLKKVFAKSVSFGSLTNACTRFIEHSSADRAYCSGSTMDSKGGTMVLVECLIFLSWW